MGATATPAKTKFYRGHKVLSVTPKTAEELETLKGLESNDDLELDFWTDPMGDPNRNWDAAFGTTGVSRNPCSDIYPGPHPWSEPETRSLSQTIMSLKDQWKVGPPSHILYEASGGAYDWAKMKAGIKYAYTLECRPNTMRPGFMLPASGIIPSGEETWAGVKYVAEFLVQKY